MRKLKAVCVALCFLFCVNWLIEWWECRRYNLENELIHQNRIEQPDTDPFDVQTDEKWKEKRECLTKEINIAFLKTHKTASSTVTSILNRFADINNLDIAVPNGDTRFNWPSSFTLAAVDQSRLKDKRANVLCNHSVLNRKELVKAMKSGFRLITILRDPVEQIYSLFHYENFTKIYQIPPGEDPVEHFFANTSSYYRQFKSRMWRKLFMLENLLKNGMTFDLNFQRFKKRIVKNSFQDFVTYIDRAFHLVLITEKFDESLLLLKQLMCWNYMDIVYMKKLVNHKLHKQQKKRKKELLKKIRNWSNLDVILYEHFRKKLENILALQDQDKFQEKLLIFRTLNNLLTTYCRNTTAENYYEVIEMLRELKEEPPEMFLNKPKCFCNKLERSELDYLKYFKNKFTPLYFLERLRTGKKLKDDC
ncbi:galactose-3-O-sulfotransferase 4-like [Hydractinia symbiolongicarpus]|uniref:galactose-3-O-sulfotransferase 4-like n=1 Tax=Hydractinia symbiolongicarpus TaxID=13093 RepID=UPI00254FB9C5|nr:galactose-3-O-sulfotransferase 4-like [Hydractinia symbiolongicarpus]